MDIKKNKNRVVYGVAVQLKITLLNFCHRNSRKKLYNKHKSCPHSMLKCRKFRFLKELYLRIERVASFSVWNDCQSEPVMMLYN